MDNLEMQLDALLKDPELMDKLTAAAKSLSGAGTEEPGPGLQIDPAMISRLSGLFRQGSIDTRQQALIHALGPYLSHDRVEKLEKAMQAARVAKIAAAVTSSGGQSLFGGR